MAGREARDAQYLAATGMNLKTPPAWDTSLDKQYPLRIWMSDMLLWDGATEVDVQRRGPAVVMRLSGVAREIAREIDPGTLSQGRAIFDAQGQQVGYESGVEALVSLLRRRFHPLEREIQVSALSEVFQFTWQDREGMDDVLAR